MSWTRGQSSRPNQSPFIDPNKEDTNQSPPSSGNYTQNNHYRRENNPRIYQQSQQHGRDIAATFTQEGLQTFSTIFSSAVDAAISKSLPDIVERAIERKMKDVLNQTLNESKHAISEFITHMVQTTQIALEKRLDDLMTVELERRRVLGSESASNISRHGESLYVNSDESPMTEVSSIPEVSPAVTEMTMDLTLKSTGDAPVTDLSSPVTTESLRSAQAPATGAKLRTRAHSHLDGEVENIVEFLKRMERPVKMEEMRATLHGIEWGKNASIKMTTLMNRANGQIERISKGIYRYKEVL